MPGPNFPYTDLDANQVLIQSFDETQDKLRVDASVSVTSITGDVTVEVDAADGDNIALASPDGSKKVTVTTVGAKEALDVNVVSAAGGVSTPLIQNVTIVSANTEQSLVFASSTKRIRLQLRDVATLKFAFSPGTSGTTYITVPAGSGYEVDNLALSASLTLYFQTTKASTTLEVISWS